MNTVTKILKCHAEVYDPHKQIMESLRINKKLYGILILILLEALLGWYFMHAQKDGYALLTLCLFIVTVGISSLFHFKLVENLYGSVENLDNERMQRFCQSVLHKSNINLLIENENTLVESLIKEKLEKIQRLEQAKKNIYLGLITVVLPLFITFLIKNLDNIEFLTLTIMTIGLIILLFAFKSSFKEYTTISKLEHINELLKELRLSQIVESRIILTQANEQNENEELDNNI
ncbi:hypothetical protein [Cytobacillus dafuensis]|uniref:Uncharacterized protein n=1 Tax=Cytobacillus dafuensis TaxID=1742359 RepID=A0A5B8Z8T2_CYTDA|nr:hypothetical protein [Cytobacillus dafuensis]QED49368.1 hypothetical protein FSZ17_20040 [Cytobacillus dafuensis]